MKHNAAKDKVAIQNNVSVIDVMGVAQLALCRVTKHRTKTIVNITSGKSTANSEVIRCVKEEVGGHVPIEIKKARKGEVSTPYRDIYFAKNIFGWAPKNSDTRANARSLFQRYFML